MSKINLVVALLILLYGCSSGKLEKIESVSADSTKIADSNSNAFISSSAAVENGKDTTRRFVRTAELKFKVKSVIKSTYDIENITNRNGGFVTNTNLTSNVNNVTTTAISSDSSLETTYYTVTNIITIRVPNTKLDTTLTEISNNIDYLDFRVIKAEDVALQILSNNLTQKRSVKNEERLTNAINNRGKKLNETTDAEELLLNKQEQADNAKVSNLSLTDQIKFSTINLSIYQRQSVKRELISNEKNIDAYEPGFGKQIFEALKFGWDMIQTFLVFLIKMWGIILFAILVYFIYKKYGQKLNKLK